MQATKKTIQKENCAGLTQSCPATTDVGKRTTMCEFYRYLTSDLIDSSLFFYLNQLTKVCLTTLQRHLLCIENTFGAGED